LPVLLEQPHKSCLLEMAVRGNRLGQPALAHDDETDAVDDGPILIRTGRPESPGGDFEGRVNLDDLD
jgi:hypothetical protein